MKRKYMYYVFPFLGTVFCLWYVFAAACDGIYSDYVRLVNSYLPDVWNPAKFFVPDVLTRIPVNYLERIINVSLFGYNTMFDRVLGVLALGLSGVVLGSYCKRKQVSLWWFALLMGILFSLNKWEMLTNGSGWAHFLAFTCFYYHYVVLDRVWSGEEKKHDRTKLLFLPFLITLLVAGPYCAIYCVAVILTSILLYFREKRDVYKKQTIFYGLNTLISLLLYLLSNHYAIYDYEDPATVSIVTQLKDTPSFFVRFFLKSFSTMVIEKEQAQKIFHTTNAPFFLLGFVVVLLYFMALWLYWRYRLYEETILPLILMVAGGLNHVIVLLSRWIFLNENYGMSSRYALQFQVGVLGIVLTFALLLKRKNIRQSILIRGAASFACALFLFGNVYTTYVEIKKAPYRLQYLEKRTGLALKFEQLTDEELRENFDYKPSRADSGEKVRCALTILKENGYSVFRNSH